jgi:uncharacterized LabA/DUF88 family protein
MTPQNTIQNNYAFIDSQNLNLAVKSLGWKLDFERFYIYLKDRFSVTRTFLFIGYMAGNESLYTYLQSAGYILIFKPILEIKGKIKGNVDAELVLHTMIEYSNYDKAIIVSGDGDFHCLIEYLITQKKLARLIAPSRKGMSCFYNKELIREYITHLDGTKEKLGKKENNKT